MLSLTCVSGGHGGSFGMDVEVLTELLLENGALSVVVEDADYGTERERPIFDEPDEAQAEAWFRVPSEASGDNFWSNCNVTAYFTKDFNIPGTVDMVTTAMGLPVTPRYSIDLVPDRDWVKVVQREWKPILIDDLVLRFPWHSSADVQDYLKAQVLCRAPPRPCLTSSDPLEEHHMASCPCQSCANGDTCMCVVRRAWSGNPTTSSRSRAAWPSARASTQRRACAVDGCDDSSRMTAAAAAKNP